MRPRAAAPASIAPALPALLFLAVFFLLPVAMLLSRSVTDPVPGLQNFEHLASTPAYGRVLLNTLLVSFLVTVSCLVIAFPIAWFLVVSSRRVSRLVMGIIVLSMWTSLLARLFALLVLLQNSGAINGFLMAIGLISHPLPLVNNLTGVVIGLTYIMLPFMVLPIHATLSGLDPAIPQAASICGATSADVFFRVLLPLATPGISTGCILVFVTTLGYFIAPAMLGGPSDIMIGQLIVEQVQTYLNWGLGAAAALVLLVTTLTIYLVYVRVTGLDAKV
ncbi:MAG: ABC transporter permease [Parvibaculaceae bacterium]